MKITEVEVIPVGVPLKRPHKMAIGTVKQLDSVLLILRTDEGITGIGEAAPAPFFSHETQESVVGVLSRYIGPYLIGKDPFNLEAIFSTLDKEVKGNPFAKTAVDLACHDIMGKAFGVPVYRLIGGKVRDKIPLSWSLASADTEKDLKEAEEMIEQGVNIFKIKAGVLTPQQDVERVRAIRKALGDGPDLRVDANQGWTAEVAVSVIKQIEDCGITFVEQPVPMWDIDGMRKVAKDVTVPVMVDEGLFTLDDAIRYVKYEAADIFGIKIMKHHGLRGSKQVAAVARGAGLNCYLGARMELSVAAAASVHFGVSTPEVRYGCEEFCHLLTEDVIVENPITIEDGCVKSYEGEGLGVTLDWAKVKRFTVGQKIVIKQP